MAGMAPESVSNQAVGNWGGGEQEHWVQYKKVPRAEHRNTWGPTEATPMHVNCSECAAQHVGMKAPTGVVCGGAILEGCTASLAGGGRRMSMYRFLLLDPQMRSDKNTVVLGRHPRLLPTPARFVNWFQDVRTEARGRTRQQDSGRLSLRA